MSVVGLSSIFKHRATTYMQITILSLHRLSIKKRIKKFQHAEGPEKKHYGPFILFRYACVCIMLHKIFLITYSKFNAHK